MRISDVRVKVDRDNTTINPTNCDPMAVTSHVTGTGGDVNSTADDTAAGPLHPLPGGQLRQPALQAEARLQAEGRHQPRRLPGLHGDADAAGPATPTSPASAVTLPHSEFLAQDHIRTVCTRVQFAAERLPGGLASTATPRRPRRCSTRPLEGPVYLRSSNNPLPDLVAELDGEIDVEARRPHRLRQRAASATPSTSSPTPR